MRCSRVHPPRRDRAWRPGGGVGSTRDRRLLRKTLHHVGTAGLAVAAYIDKPHLLGVLEELAEAAIAVARLAERGLLPLHRVFHHGGEDGVFVLADQRRDGLEEQVEHFLLLRGTSAGTAAAGTTAGAFSRSS